MLSECGSHRYQPQLDPQPEQQQLACPRCDSTDTKFCYYNNYNLSQPRHFCKSCRRYWTRGGSLRNVPVGGSKRSRTPPSDSAPENPTKPTPPISDEAPVTGLDLNDGVCGDTWQVEGGVNYLG